MFKRQKLHLLYLIFASTSVLADSQPANPCYKIPPLINESFEDYSLRTYANCFGISKNEAKRRLKLDEKVGDLGEKLQQDNPDTFAGMWLEHTPRYRLVANFTAYPKKNISEYITDPEVVAFIDIEVTATVSLADLRKMRDEAVEALASEGISHLNSDIDVEKNQVELYVLRNDYLKSIKALKKRGKRFPANIKIIKATSFSKNQLVARRLG